ncbi:hypothetical protein ABZ897_54305 [Nonomuraea sp. NPDC046802]|uniref:hypothetical protein n=1 Tax=Nonomuraea sp. NPDC046802 TaxID=3154919 RepID=UPI0033E4906D
MADLLAALGVVGALAARAARALAAVSALSFTAALSGGGWLPAGYGVAYTAALFLLRGRRDRWITWS